MIPLILIAIGGLFYTFGELVKKELKYAMGGLNLLSSMRIWLDQFYLALRKELDGED